MSIIYVRKFIPQNLQVLVTFGDPQNFIPLKIPCLVLYAAYLI